MIAVDIREAASLLEQAESGVAALYRSCARVFPGDAELWTRLMREELQHAEYIRQAEERIAAQPERFPLQRKFDARSVREFVRNVQDFRQRVESGSVGKREALLAAYQIEETYIEKRFADAAFSDYRELLPLYTHIVTETAAHRQLLKDALDAEMRRPVPAEK